MTLIRVSPAILSESSGKINSVAENIRNASRGLWNGLDGAPFYDGQFSPRIRMMGLETQARAQVMALHMNALSGSLSRRAAAFEAMDQAGAIGMGALSFFQMVGGRYLQFLKTWTGAIFEKVQRLLRYGMLGFEKIKNLSLEFLTGILNLIGGHRTIQPKNTPKETGATESSEEGENGSLPETGGIATVVQTISTAAVISHASAQVTQNYHGDHRAIDIYAPGGTALNASYKGKVVFSSEVNCGRLYSAPSKEDNVRTNYGYGNMMVVEYKFDDQPPEVQEQWAKSYGMKAGQSLYGLYAHLQDGSLTPAGTELQAGDPFAAVGNTGHCEGTTGYHVHLAVKVADSNMIQNPSVYGSSGWYKMGTTVNPGAVTEFLPVKG